ncbi:MAG TPA: acetoacetate--CoA ligase [Alphaproteobacteria bacterium]|nr:acetoacetate--CoA ligase [Alphaproteobacteria bacterium]
MDDVPLWRPHTADMVRSDLIRFMHAIGPHMADYNDIWEWSVENPGSFWDRVWDFCGVIGHKGPRTLVDADKMPGARFFPDSRLNYAENLLRRRDESPAIIFKTEQGAERTLTFAGLYGQVSRWVQALRAAGVAKGDRVAGFMPNAPETIIAMLATASIGAVWSSASPDFGVQGVVDRFGQIEPKILMTVDGYYYGGKTVDCLAKIREIQPRLSGLTKTIVVPYVSAGPDLTGLENTVGATDFLAPYVPQDIAFEPVEFTHPLFIMYSSGTTGVPKCIVHGHGGTLLQHLKEHRLQCGIRPGDRVFYFTTCGWMMWNWLASALASEATVLLYDGSPFYPDGNVLWDFTSRNGCTFFGTSAKYIDTLKSHGLRPGQTYDLSALRTVASTGSPLVHESFDYVYDAIKKDLHLASISGGTDIVSCFVLGNPVSPVWRGEIQGAGLGMAVNVFNEAGEPLPPGAGSGELVCTRPFPAMPVMFWNDPEGTRYRAAYFERFPNVWCHGDWIERTAHGGFIIHGRSDATLNPGGVRIGTAEIYRQVEQIPDILESIAVGQDWQGDVRVILFVRLKPGCTLTDSVLSEIKTRIREGASPRHVPARIVAVEDIPRTKSGKITELAVRDVIHGRPIRNVEALANPEALHLYENLEALRG